MAEPVHSRSGVERLADHLEKPAIDNRLYRVVKLPNQLEALLIHDPETDKASAAMDVNVGSFSDPEDMPGIAHAVEHLLFMGTEKYPGENDYNQYLTKFGGYSNAFTAATSTNYYFELSASAKSNSPGSSANTSKESLASIPKGEVPLYGGLDRFAQFFIHPLFLEDTLDRELKAVDSENKKNLQTDVWRINQLNKSLSSKKHPFHGFSTGNFKVLHDDPIQRGVMIRDEFINFYQKNYSANRMKLVVLGKESLDELEGWVVELFSDVKNQDLPKLRWDTLPIYDTEDVGTQIFAKPVMDQRNLDIYFTYPDEEDLYESQPSRYISHLIGHEGPGSILAYLKAKGWANGLASGAHPVCPGSALFMLQIRLTEDGLKHYQEIVQIVFQYIAMLKEEPPHEWIVDELMKLTEVDFKFRSKIPASRTTSMYSGVMQKPLPRDKLLSGQCLIRKFDAKAIKRGLAHLDPDNFRIVLISKELPVETDSKEKWYGTEYKYEKIPQGFMRDVKKAAKASASERPSELRLPAKNEFVPQRLDVEKKEVDQPLMAPKLIRNEDNVRTWFKKDDQFWVPKANVDICLRSPLVNMTPLMAVMAQLYRELVEDSLAEYSYDADIAGLGYSIQSHARGMDVSVSGYNDKMAVLLEKVLVSMRDLKITQERFEIIKERVTRGFKNFEYQEPFRQINTYSQHLTSQRAWAHHQLLDELPAITADDVRAFFPQLLKQIHIEVFVIGNLYKEDALHITDLVQSTLKPKRLPASQWSTRRSIMLPPGSDYLYQRTLANPDNINHCIEYIIFIGCNVDRVQRAKLLLLADLTSEPCFDQLRTKEQLGYVVSSGALIYSTVAAYRVLIQSEKDCGYLEKRIDAFLTGYESALKDMPTEEFEAHKIGLINKRLEKLKSLGAETARFWHHITSEVYDFELVHRDVENIEPLTKEDMLEFFRSYFLPSSPTRAKASVHLIAQASAEDIAAKTDPAEQKERLAGVLAQVLGQLGVEVDNATLVKKLDKVDVAGGDTAGMLGAVGGYLKETAGVAADQIEQVMQQGQAVLAQVLPSLGISTKPTAPEVDGEVAVNGDAATEKASKTVLIEDVPAFKASMPLSAGAKPVKDLSEFEELESKL
ncbi:hypothetical protein LTR36_008321 [Oleoguttula mirabilis]|uniref:Uncharacterized protein n=1 Tax=Oleoguttula mirabilis TaxID=1507867 RepID=A0AAV9J8S4_9PEZI|nr:hypothetical protein LTR36_008321 [Oleoguttula mirabilis]